MNLRADIRTAIVLGILFLGLFAITIPRNHSEADHAFRYAWDVEHEPARETLHRHHLLYIPLAKVAHTGAQYVDRGIRAYPIMIALSMLGGTLALAFLFLAMKRHLAFSTDVAFFSTGLIGASYGFWRYACEAGPPVVAAAPLTLAFYILTSPKVNALRVLGAAVAAALAVLLHMLALIPTLFAFPALLMGRGRRAPLLLYILLLIGLICMAYAVTDVSPFGDAQDNIDDYGDISLAVQGPSTVGNAALGLGRSVLSGNYLFCIRPFREFMQRVFTHRMMREEMLIGTTGGTAAAILPLVLLGLLSLVALLVLDDRLSISAQDIEQKTAAPQRPIRSRTFIAVVVWAVLHTLVMLTYEPANPQNWILFLIPLWIGLILLWARDPRGIPRQALGTLFVLLLLHNYFGGMHLLGDPMSDYNKTRSQWLIDHAQANDTILTDETPAFCWYLRYHTPANIVPLSRFPSAPAVTRLIENAHQQGGHVLATDDVFAGPEQTPRRTNQNTAIPASAREKLRELFVRLPHSGPKTVSLLPPGNDKAQ